MLVEKIEAIRDSEDIEANKVIGSELLDVILVTDTMTDEQKLNFKQILKPFVYGGLENVPEQEIAATEDKDDTEESSGRFMESLKFIIKVLAILGLIVVAGIVILWISYRLKNNDKNIGFQDYIIDRTKESDTVVEKTTTIKEEKHDVLSEMKSEKVKEEALTPPTGTLSLEGERKNSLSSEGEGRGEVKKEIVEPEVKTDGAVPDWLTGASAASETTTVAKETPSALTGSSLNEGAKKKAPKKSVETVPTRGGGENQ